MKNLMAWALVVGALSLVGPAWGQDKPTKKADVPQTIVLDVSKLPPEVVAQLLKLASGEKKPDAVEGGKKPIKVEGDKKAEGLRALSLGHAVTQAEKGGKGPVVKAERTGDVFVITTETGEVIKYTATKAPEKKPAAGAKKSIVIPRVKKIVK